MLVFIINFLQFIEIFVLSSNTFFDTSKKQNISINLKRFQQFFIFHQNYLFYENSFSFLEILLIFLKTAFSNKFILFSTFYDSSNFFTIHQNFYLFTNFSNFTKNVYFYKHSHFSSFQRSINFLDFCRNCHYLTIFFLKFLKFF